MRQLRTSGSVRGLGADAQVYSTQTSSGAMQCFDGLAAGLGLGVALHIQGDATLHLCQSPNAINCLLHFAMPAVAALNGIGSGRKQGIVQECQCLFQIGRKKFFQCFADRFEAPNTLAQFCQFLKRALGATAAVKEPVDLIHNGA